MDADACPVGAAGAELTDDDVLPYVCLFAGVLERPGVDLAAVEDRAAEYRAIFAGVPEVGRWAHGRRFLDLCHARGV